MVFNLKVIKDGLMGKDGFKKFLQLGNIPLFVAQIINKLPLGLLGRFLE
jgi:hypothetical protein